MQARKKLFYFNYISPYHTSMNAKQDIACVVFVFCPTPVVQNTKVIRVFHDSTQPTGIQVHNSNNFCLPQVVSCYSAPRHTMVFPWSNVQPTEVRCFKRPANRTHRDSNSNSNIFILTQTDIEAQILVCVCFLHLIVSQDRMIIEYH